jgi:hypothetical protein
MSFVTDSGLSTAFHSGRQLRNCYGYAAAELAEWGRRTDGQAQPAGIKVLGVDCHSGR